MFRDPEYLKWANDETIHVFAYSLDPDATKPEPMVDVDRDGTKASVFKAYPMFTSDEMESLRGELEKRLLYPSHTPWAAVVDADGMKILVELTKSTAKEFRSAYEAEQKKHGLTLGRADWLKIRAAIQASTDAEFDGAWKKAVESAVAARDAGKAAPAPMKEAIDARLASLASAGKTQLDAAKNTKDSAERAKAVAKVLEDFRALPLHDDGK